MGTFLVTGATSGIGLHIAHELLKQGHRVISVARNMKKAEKTKTELIANTGNRSIEFYEADFASFATVKQCAARIREKYDSLDVLLNNAGTWEVDFSETSNGIETNLQVNHLSPMLLTLELIPVLMRSGRSRIINTSSGAHRRDILNLEDLEFRKGTYSGIASYSQSKLLNILFSTELINRLKNRDITVNTVHPGYVKTALFNKMGVRNWEGIPDAGFGAKSALYAALSPDMEGVSGKYLYLNQEDPNLSDMAVDKILAKKVWDLSIDYLKDFTVNH